MQVGSSPMMRMPRPAIRAGGGVTPTPPVLAPAPAPAPATPPTTPPVAASGFDFKALATKVQEVLAGLWQQVKGFFSNLLGKIGQ